MKCSYAALFLASVLCIWSHTWAADVQDKIERAYIQAEKEIKHLDDGNFTETVSHGLWLVFLGAKWCRHCQMLTPKWLQLQQKAAPLEDRNVFVRKMECTTRENDDFCANIMKLTGYPTIRLFFKGSPIEDYKGAPETDELYKFLVDRATQFLPKQDVSTPVKEQSKESQHQAQNVKVADLNNQKTHEVGSNSSSKDESRNQLDNLDSQVQDEMRRIQSLIDTAGPVPVTLNPEGTIIHLSGSTFSETLESGPVFVMFHAPWCGHCKKLAPVWEELAGNMKNRLNIAKVDCTAESVLCKQNSVMGYPTLKYFAEGETFEFHGSRTLDGLQTFVEDVSSSQVVFPVKHDDVRQLMQNSDVAFFYVYDLSNPPTDGKQLISAVKTLRGNIRIYVCPDIRALKALGVSNQASGDPILVVSKDRGTELEVFSPFATNGVLDWIKSRRLPLVQELDEQTSGQILSSGNLIVMGALLNPETAEESKTNLKALRDMAKSWNRFVREKKRTYTKEVTFVWIDGSRRNFGDWLSRTYSLNTEELPCLLIIDTKEESFYDTHSNGSRLTFDPKTTTAIAEILRGKRRGKSPGGYLGWIMKNVVRVMSPLGMLIIKHPLLMTLSVIGLIILVIYLAVSGEDSTTAIHNEKPE